MVFLILGTSLDLYLEKNDNNKINGYMFDNYKYAVSSAKLQPLSEHSKIDIESGMVLFIKLKKNIFYANIYVFVQNLRRALKHYRKFNP